MSVIEEHIVKDPNGNTAAFITPAEPADVDFVLSQDENSKNGRSNWLWVTLPDGDVMLGVFPQGATYEATAVRSNITS